MNRPLAAVLAFGALVAGLFARRAESATVPTAPRPMGPAPDDAPDVAPQSLSEWLGNAMPDLQASQLPAARQADDTIVRVTKAGAGWTEVALADGRVVRRTGVRSWRNNNPGNIEYGSYAAGQGAVGSDGRFAVFPTYEAGQRAREALLFEAGTYRGLTLPDAIARYAPPTENNTAMYTRAVLAAVGGASRRMADYSASERVAILAAMERVEGWKVGIVTSTGSTA